MANSLLHCKFNFADMIAILKNGKSYHAVCRSMTQHLLELIDVAVVKVELLIKTNQEIDALLAVEHLEQHLGNLDVLCSRSADVFQEIEHLPLLREDPALLAELLALSKLGSRYAELLNLLYTQASFIAVRTNSLHDSAYVHVM